MRKVLCPGDVLKNGATVVAVRPRRQSDYLFVLFCEVSDKSGVTPYVTWLFNSHRDLCFEGRYFENEDEAYSDFQAR